MADGLTLVEEFDALPPHRQGWRTFGRTRAHEVHDLGSPPRLTLGERLLRTYVAFAQVDTRERDAARTFAARSATGTQEFRVRVQAKYKVAKPDLAAAEGLDDPEAAVLDPIESLAADVAERHGIEEFRSFQSKLREDLEPKVLIQARTPALQIVSARAWVDPPPHLANMEDTIVALSFLDTEIAMAEYHGDADKAKRLRAARAALDEARAKRMDGLRASTKGTQDVQRVIRDLLDNNDLPRDHPILREFERQMSDIVVGGSDPLRAAVRSPPGARGDGAVPLIEPAAAPPPRPPAADRD